MFVVNKNMTIGEVIRQDPNTAALLNQYGMHCTSCPLLPDGISGAGRSGPRLRCGRSGKGAERAFRQEGISSLPQAKTR